MQSDTLVILVPSTQKHLRLVNHVILKHFWRHLMEAATKHSEQVCSLAKGMSANDMSLANLDWILLKGIEHKMLDLT